MLLSAFTLVHVLISLVGIGSGFVVLWGMLAAKRLDGWTATFLATTVATSVTGFMFPFHRFMPSHAVGILSLLVLAVTLFARYRRRLAGHWRLAYVVTAVLALYLNVFVLVAQSFQKVPPLKALAPTGSETPFAVSQGAVLCLFVALGIAAALRFRTEPTRAVSLAARLA